jgi:signal transduction histidine kinase
MNSYGRHIRSAFRRLRDPLIVVGSDGVIRAANPAARDVLDFEDGGGIRDARWIDRRVRFDGTAISSLVDGDAEVFGHRLTDLDGNDADIAVDIIDLGGAKDGARIKLIHIKDYSADNNYERWKDELVSMAAHEIKNPLSAMKISMKTLVSQAAGTMVEGQRDLLAVSIRSIDRLTRLLDNLLDVSRIKSGNYTPEPKWVDVREFTAEVVGTFKTLFNVRRQRLGYSVSDELGRVYVDAPKLEQIIINILNNAVKFTPEGGEVELSVERAGLEVLADDLRILPWQALGTPVFVRFTVRDTGIGMTGETVSHLFTRYHSGNDRGGAGSHLGMSISKTLAEVQNGSLDIESELGLGTRVSVSVPSDERTFALIGRLRSMDRVLPRLVARRQGVTSCVARNDASLPWSEFFEGWPARPVVNPVVDDEKSGECFAWTLGDRVAVAVFADAGGPGGPYRFLVSREKGGRRKNAGAKGAVTAVKRLSARDARASALVGLAFKPFPDPLQAGARERSVDRSADERVDSIQRPGE